MFYKKYSIFLTILSFLLVSIFPTLVYASVEIAVPFTPQAPYANWIEPWKNACEEASVAMMDAFYNKQTSLTKYQAKADILNIFSIKNSFIGSSYDESANTIVTLINNFLSWEAYIIENPTIEDIKKEIDNGNPVIIPVYANLLNNPHFLGTFPYHMLVISGYDDTTEEFITQEPGTRHGENYRYSYSTINSAIHDYSPTNMATSPKRAIGTRKQLLTSSQSDGDKDGLTKEEETEYKTSLAMSDTDKDGYLDGEEVQNGYSPTTKNKKLLTNNSVVKVDNASTVFLYNNGTLSPFRNEKAFLSRGYKWSDIIIIPATYRDLQTRGTVLY